MEGPVVIVILVAMTTASYGQFKPNLFQSQNSGSQSVPGLFNVLIPNDSKNNGGSDSAGWPFYSALLPPQHQPAFSGGFPNNFQQSSSSGNKQDGPGSQQTAPYVTPEFSGLPASPEWFNPKLPQRPGSLQGKKPSGPYQHVVPQQDFKNPNWTLPERDQGGYHQMSYQNKPQNAPFLQMKPSSQKQPLSQGSPSQVQPPRYSSEKTHSLESGDAPTEQVDSVKELNAQNIQAQPETPNISYQ